MVVTLVCPGSRYDEVIREELERALKALLTVTPIFVQDNAVGIQMSFVKIKGWERKDISSAVVKRG